MTRRRTQQPRNNPQSTQDSFVNLAAGQGVGYGIANQISQAFYQYNPQTRNRSQLELAHRGNWIANMAVRATAEDMTRKGIEIFSDIKPDDKRKLDKMLMRDSNELTDALTWANLFGGGVAILLIEGQDPETPLDISSIPKGGYHGLAVFDRWQCYPDWSAINFTYGPQYGLPIFYNLYGQLYGGGTPFETTKLPDNPTNEWYQQNKPLLKVHYTRVLRFEGIKLPRYQEPQEQFWGASILEPCWDMVHSANTVSLALANAITRSNINVYKVDGYRQIVGNSATYNQFAAQLQLMRQGITNEGLTVVDAKDEFEMHAASLGGMQDSFMTFMQQISGAIQVPLTRLLGQSPAGLNATGDADLENYYTGIARRQERMLRKPMMTLLSVYHRHLWGKDMDAEFDFDFMPLWEIDDKEQAELSAKITDSIIKAYDTGLISQMRALEELKSASDRTGLFHTISDEEISSAQVEVPDPMDVPEEVIMTEEENLDANKEDQ